MACDGNARLLTVDLVTWRVTGDVPVGVDPDVLAWDPAARRLYVACESGWLTIADLHDRTLAVAEREAAHSFDAPGAEYTHEGNLCTFEVLIQRHRLGDDPALMRLAAIVHATDISADLTSDPLGPGLLALGVGGLDVEPDDHVLLERGSFVYDALYAWCRRQTAEAGAAA